ncbi:UNKNOWN [Stylonychia lemnae]|uniref:Cytosolic carboxypeptidase-like protein 5 n=1 Tax=Stylonychia lemnae TaxID=5949 RepID=A0A078BDC7_STYLE|nr:UNKNOWN [Stylonychia lemnae]|eukprot:CDW91598.1 UNKNOWN [Stylonychia lemnae]
MKSQKRQSIKRQMTNQGSNDQSSEAEEITDKKQKPSYPVIQCMIDNVNTLEVLKTMNPQQNTFNFGSITITSAFDSGNLARCEEGDEVNNVRKIQNQFKLQFNMWIATDSLPYFKNCGYRTWFYFGVKGTIRDQVLSFTIKNMNHQSKLYASGLRPVYRLGMQSKWRRCNGKCSWISAPEGTSVTFEHSFSGQERDDQLLYIAFTYPFSYSETTEYFDKIQDKISKDFKDQIYIHRELLTYSLEDRNVELITITGLNGVQTQEREEGIPTLCNKVEGKKCIVLSARVHPGEVQSSFVLNGIIDFLVSNTEQSKILLENYVFKVIPLLNPDGVYRGYFRLDTYNHNLNRFYIDPDPKLQPTIYAARQAILQQHQYGNLHIYLDLHGHAVKKGCFIFGNALKGEEQAQNMLFAKLIALNCLNFDFAECSFAEKLMSVKDRGCGLSREGSGRVALYKACGLINCYTLECNFQTGRRINHLTPKINVATGEIEPELPITDANNKIYKENKTPSYTIEIFEDVGRAVCLALLDLIEKNPVTRLLSSQYKTVTNLNQSNTNMNTATSANSGTSSQNTAASLVIQSQSQATRNNSSSNSAINRQPIVYVEKTPKNPNTSFSSHAQKFMALTQDKKSSFLQSSQKGQLIGKPLEEIKEQTKQEQQQQFNLSNQNKGGKNKDKQTLKQLLQDNANTNSVNQDEAKKKPKHKNLRNDVSSGNIEHNQSSKKINRIGLNSNHNGELSSNTNTSGLTQEDPFFLQQDNDFENKTYGVVKHKIKRGLNKKNNQFQQMTSLKNKIQGGMLTSDLQQYGSENFSFIDVSQTPSIPFDQITNPFQQELRLCNVVQLDLNLAQPNSQLSQQTTNQQTIQSLSKINQISMAKNSVQNSSHHFSSQNSVFLPQNIIAPNSAQALYQLSQGGNKLVPKLLEKHNTRMKSQVSQPQQKQQLSNISKINASTSNNIGCLLTSNQNQQDDQKDNQSFSKAFLNRKSQNVNITQQQAIQSQQLQQQSRFSSNNSNIAQDQSVRNLQNQIFGQQQMITNAQGKRMMSNNLWNKIKSSSFNYQGGIIGSAAEAAE